MYLLHIKRVKEFADSTLSSAILYASDGQVSFELSFVEPAGPSTEEANQDRRIPAGLYSVDWEPSTTAGNDIAGKLPLLSNVKVSKDRRIRIHIGNYGKDTEGCLCPGLTANMSGGFVNSSRKALTRLLEICFNADLKVLITEEF